MYVRLRKVVGIFVFVFLCAVPVHTFAVGFSGVGGKPAYQRSDNPRTSSIFVHTISPGESASDGVMVVNNTGKAEVIELYATNSARSSGGSFACGQRVRRERGIADWIHLGEVDTVTVEPNDHLVVDFTITVPEGTSAGEYNGCIIIQKKKSEGNKKGVSLSFRTGIRIAITVPGVLVRKLENPVLSLEKREDGVIQVKTSIDNTGNVSIDTDVAVGVRDIFGRVVAKQGGGFPVLREDKRDFVFNFNEEDLFWGGRYVVYADYSYEGGTSSLGEGTGDQDQVVQAESIILYMYPSVSAYIIYGIVLVILIFLFVFVLLRRGRKKRFLVYTVKSGESIQDVAEKTSVSWKKIAKINSIGPPYQLQEGERLKIKVKK